MSSGTPPDILFQVSKTDASGPLGAASQFYSLTLSNPQGGTLHSHVTTGTDWTPGVGAYDARIQLDFGGQFINGSPVLFNSDYLVIDPAKLDLFTVILHEAGHALGIASLIDGSGKSALTASTAGPFALFDSFLVTGGTTTHLLTGASPIFTASPSDLISNAIQYLHPAASANAVARLPIVSADPFSVGASLSHFDPARPVANSNGTPYSGVKFTYVMGSGKLNRRLTDPELDVLCDLGYDLGSTCHDHFPIGIDDAYSGVSPRERRMHRRDRQRSRCRWRPAFRLSSSPCVPTIVNGNGVGSAVTRGNGRQICYTAAADFVGPAVVTYCPTDGTRTGNVTRAQFDVAGSSCPGDPCNLVCNGGFEGGNGDGTYAFGEGCLPERVNDWCPLWGTPDIFRRDSFFNFYRIPMTACPGGINTWDGTGTGNNKFAGGGFYISANESMYTHISEGRGLAKPLTPGRSYRLSLKANTTPGESGTMKLGFTIPEPPDTLTTFDFIPPGLETPPSVPNCVWTTIDTTFSAPASPVGLEYLVISPRGTGPTWNWMLWDSVRLEETGPALNVITSVDNPAPLIGDIVTFSIKVCNLTNSAVTNVVVQDSLPTGLTVSPGGTFTYPQYQILTSIPPQLCTNNFTLKALVTPAAPVGPALTNCAVVSSTSSACGSTGQNCVSVTVQGLGSIQGMKFNDQNGNGSRDPGEQGLAAWQILLRDATGAITSTTTDSQGISFANLNPGAYTVSEVTKVGWRQTFPHPETRTRSLSTPAW